MLDWFCAAGAGEDLGPNRARMESLERRPSDGVEASACVCGAGSEGLLDTAGAGLAETNALNSELRPRRSCEEEDATGGC